MTITSPRQHSTSVSTDTSPVITRLLVLLLLLLLLLLKVNITMASVSVLSVRRCGVYTGV